MTSLSWVLVTKLGPNLCIAKGLVWYLTASPILSISQGLADLAIR
jgi:hypothetical protein